jgi:hypothetical protein
MPKSFPLGKGGRILKLWQLGKSPLALFSKEGQILIFLFAEREHSLYALLNELDRK